MPDEADVRRALEERFGQEAELLSVFVQECQFCQSQAAPHWQFCASCGSRLATALPPVRQRPAARRRPLLPALRPGAAREPLAAGQAGLTRQRPRRDRRDRYDRGALNGRRAAQ